MAAGFAHVTEEEIDKIKEDSISTKTKQATKYGAKTFQAKGLVIIYARTSERCTVETLSFLKKLVFKVQFFIFFITTCWTRS